MGEITSSKYNYFLSAFLVLKIGRERIWTQFSSLTPPLCSRGSCCSLECACVHERLRLPPAGCYRHCIAEEKSSGAGGPAGVTDQSLSTPLASEALTSICNVCLESWRLAACSDPSTSSDVSPAAIHKVQKKSALSVCLLLDGQRLCLTSGRRHQHTDSLLFKLALLGSQWDSEPEGSGEHREEGNTPC